MESLTKKQMDVLGYLKTQIMQNKVPSFREIMREFRFKGIRAVEGHLGALEKKGYIKREKGRARSIVISGLQRLNPIELPVLGRIAAGSPILAEENIEGTIAVDRSWVREENSFILRIYGDSMVEAGIHNGDFAIIKQDYTADNNDIVAVMLDSEVTLKRFYKKDGRIILKPENKHMKPIVIKNGGTSIRIIGKLIGVYKKYA